ncbi:hypothetical protein LRP88_13278 [Fusarium phalaenopsidis]
MGTTYNGVNGAQGGNIFKDVKFWVAQRVPLRSTWIDDIKRLDAPPGSYSWKFIEDSVRNGIIQIKDKYRIGPDPDLPRPVGAKHGAKTTRTPFTKDDDANLARWVLSQRSQQQQGNAIYQQYEAISIQRPRPQPNTAPESAPERSQSQTWPAPVLSQDDPTRQIFYEDLNDFKTTSKADIKERLNINGRTIDLFDLAMAVDASQVDSQMYDWYQVAERLGFDDPDEDTATQLQVCYDEHLSEFVAAMAAFELGDEDNVEPEAEGPEEDPFEQDVPEQASSQWPASYVPSSPPVVIGRKRSAGQRQLSAGHGTKRPRYDKDMVIPSTPDADLDAELPVVENSPSARKSSQWRGYVDESEASQHLPPLPPLQAESQDLGTGHFNTKAEANDPVNPPAIPTHVFHLPTLRLKTHNYCTSENRNRLENEPISENQPIRIHQFQPSRNSERTTLTPGNLALQVMVSLQAGRGVPSRHEGIWTDRDDADLAFVSMVDFSQSPTNTSEEMQQQRAQKAHNRLIRKHTFQRFELRKAFLRAQANQGHSKE